MKDRNCLTSACRYCRFYQPEGLHRGACGQLNVVVQSDWKACQLALPAFANTWENAKELTQANCQPELSPVAHSPAELSTASLTASTSSLSVNN
jgi:hypothetical protein